METQNKLCPVHKIAMRERKGISQKTGKNYHFWSCPHYDQQTQQYCKETWREPTKIEKEFSNIRLALKILGENSTEITKKLDKVIWLLEDKEEVPPPPDDDIPVLEEEPEE